MPYKSDLEAAHGRIAALEQELAAKPAPEEKDVKCDKCGKVDWEAVGFFGFFTAILGCLVALWVTHGDLGKCYIEESYGSYELNQVVSWGTDHDIADVPTVQEAIDIAKMLKCPLNHEAP